MLIGFGPHTKQGHYAVFEKFGHDWNFKIACGVDIKSKESEIQAYLSSQKDSPEMYYVDPDLVGAKYLNPVDEENLNKLVIQHKIDGVIISTEPSSHMLYARWALKNKISIMIEKPISARDNSSTDLDQAKGIMQDYEELLKLYADARLENPNLIVTIGTQRRYHNAFLKIKELIGEVFFKTNCPITSIQIYHADGQWRTPDEIVDLEYHGVDKGFGALSHSGYHLFDVVPFLIDAADKKDSELNNVDVVSTFIRPSDLVSQLNYHDYQNLFQEFDSNSKYSLDEYINKTKNYGEIDAYLSISLKHSDFIRTQVSISLLHNSFSQRGWLSSVGLDLSKGNGRIAQEEYQINQGPFQTIFYQTYRGHDIGETSADGRFAIGGESHIDLHIFRNNRMFTEWNTYRLINAKELKIDYPEGDAAWSSHEGARRKCLKEFVEYFQNKISRESLQSDLTTHRRGVTLESASYQSGVHRFKGENPLVNLPFTK